MWTRRPKAYDVQRDGVPILEAGITHAVSTGITYGIQVQGLVPFYEEDDVRAEARLSPLEWRQIGWLARAREVARSRIRRRIEIHVADAQAKVAERR